MDKNDIYKLKSCRKYLESARKSMKGFVIYATDINNDLAKRGNKILQDMNVLYKMVDSKLPKNILILYNKHLDIEILSAIYNKLSYDYGDDTKIYTLENKITHEQVWSNPYAFIKYLPNQIDILVYTEDWNSDKDQIVSNLEQIIRLSGKPERFEWAGDAKDGYLQDLSEGNESYDDNLC